MQTATQPANPYQAARQVAAKIVEHPGESARGLYRLYLDHFEAFDTSGSLASTLIQHHLVGMEKRDLVRREGGGKSHKDPFRWFWVGSAAAPAEPVAAPQPTESTPALAQVVASVDGPVDFKPRADAVNFTMDSRAFMSAIERAKSDAATFGATVSSAAEHPGIKIAASPISDEAIANAAEAAAVADELAGSWAPFAATLEQTVDEPICRAELCFEFGGTEMSFHHEGAWDDRAAMRLERFLFAATEGA
jgi:hypothetical protein